MDVAAITEVELAADHPPFAVDGYVTFSPLGVKKRVLLLVRAAIATGASLRQDLMHDSVQSVFVQLVTHERSRGGRTAQHRATLFAAVYRTWTDSEGSTGTKIERTHLITLIDQIERAAETRGLS